ncbi:SMP-30/gluconolactonase/LRE family protein [Limnobacter sp.]|uniref:SMP-30/gluconolactonase/LRE family protein n=1 Tax=Limnobacter sp. TaxID=2003368 RepID=UPI003516699F
MRVLVNVFAALLLLVIALVLLLFLLPSPIQAVAWQAPAAPGMDDGPYARNALLGDATVHGRANVLHAESFAIGPDGAAYTGLSNGDVVRVEREALAVPQAAQQLPMKRVGNTGGRPLGLVFHPDGYLVVADGVRGLLKLSLQGEVAVLSTASEGLPFAFVDDVDVSADGRYAYFSDASSKFGLSHYTLDILEHAGNGRLLQYDFETGQTTTLLHGLQFANGVVLSHDGRYVLVNETAAYRITRYWLKGERAGQAESFVQNLPGFPDNIRRGADGHYWVAMPSLRDPLVDKLATYPAVRNGLATLLQHIEFPVKPHAMALAFNAEGNVAANLQAPKAGGYYYYITQVTPWGDQLLMGSVHITGLAVAPNPLAK